ncbi:hypothetical protein M422DRAFT_246028 [Sphaerobolus stellatus SS14]|nr:hypothetical protein M422DRAFT_246028 [Sphaerobolus stellatus SS14]
MSPVWSIINKEFSWMAPGAEYHLPYVLSLTTPDNMDSIPSRCIIQVLRDPENSHQLRPLRILRTLWLTLCLHRRGLKILWGDESGECLAEFENAHKGGVYTGSWSPGSRNIVTSSANCTVKIWDVETRKATTT